MFRRTRVPETTPEAAHDRSDPELLLDVREVEEWVAGHAPGATHLPLSALSVEAIPEGSPVLCICRSGSRSGKAVAALRDAGVDAVNVAGGMNAWAAAGLPVVDADGRPGIVI